jgi:hypothetical protein
MAVMMAGCGRWSIVRLIMVAVVAAPRVMPAQASQPPPPRVVSRDSVTIAAGERYEAGAFARFFLGNTYRDVWTTPIRVPVLDLHTYAGGLHALKEGGGNQTKNLRFGAADGTEYVFRPADKANATPPERLRGTAVAKIFRDQVSGLFPAAGIIAAPIARAAGVLEPTPTFVVLPNDSLLGKFRKDFTDMLGTIEEYPNKPEEGPTYGGGSDVVDTDKLLPLLDSSSTHTLDTRAFLTARLVDFLVDDTDRHYGNWKWVRFGSSKAARWVPIARDRDHAFNHYDGLLARIASVSAPFLSKFEGKYQSIRALSDNSRELDRRFLANLERPVWDSIATALTRRITDAVIDSAVARLPREYNFVGPSFAAKLKQRRDGLPAITREFYKVLAEVVDVHATDAADRATVTYGPGGLVDVQIQSGTSAPYYHRRFVPSETSEIRVYLHDGDDVALVRGVAASPVRVRVIGGNGMNTLLDSSRVAARYRARLYDRGRVTGLYYGPDSAGDTLFSRRPWVNDTGTVAPPGPDFGSRFAPSVGFGTDGLGIVPKLGVRWMRYGFRKEPYSSLMGLDAEYSTGVDGYRLTLLGDRRLENSRVHFTALGRMSDFEVINFHGYGNDTNGRPSDDFFRVDQRQWQFRPAVALALGRPESDVTLGPVIQYSTTATRPDRFVAEEQPYGAGDFGQAGVRAGLRYDARDQKRGATRGFLIDMSGSAFPAMWDVTSAFSQLSGSAATYLELPLPHHPVLALRGGGRKVWGDAPFHEAAFLGGVDTLTGVDPQRYAGDASIFGNSELRIPVASIRTLLPLDIGILGFADTGRVYVDGDSPGGWHSVAGGGLWIGILDPATGVSVLLTNSRDKRVVVGTGLRF